MSSEVSGEISLSIPKLQRLHRLSFWNVYI